MIVVLNDQETYTDLIGCKVFLLTEPQEEESDCDGKLPNDPALVFNLDDPKDLRALADMLEGNK